MTQDSVELRFPELPRYLTVYLITGQSSLKVEVHSTIHVNRVVTMPHTWTPDYPIRRLRGEVFCFIIKRYGLTKDPVRYS